MAKPNSIDSNVTSLAMAEEQSLGVLPVTPVWYALEPNTVSDLGPSYTTIARTPIAAHRQQMKGTTVDMDVKAGFNQDLTQRNSTRQIQGFFMADVKQKPTTVPMNSAAIALTSVAIDGFLAAAGLGTFLVNSLCVAKGLAASGNNGLFKATVVAAGKVTTDKVLAVDAAPAAGSSIEAVGFEFPAGDCALTIVGNLVRLTSIATDMRTLGLNLGEWIFVGGDAAINTFIVKPNAGYARVAAVTQRTIDLDITTWTAQADTAVAQKIRIFFGTVLRNSSIAEVAADVTVIKKRSYCIERQLGSDGDGVQAEYAQGCIPNELKINAKEASKVTLDLSYVGCDVLTKTGLEGVIAGTRVASLMEAPFNTSLDLYSMRLAVVDGTLNPSALFAFGTDLELAINNGVTPKKALGVLGAFDGNLGLFKVTGKMTAYFNSVAAIKAIRAASDVCMNAIFARANAGMVFDVPLLTLGGGMNKAEKDKPIMVDLTQDGNVGTNGYTLLASIFEYLPTAAMPV